jgi:hypothetical protein
MAQLPAQLALGQESRREIGRPLQAMTNRLEFLANIDRM